ncbi:hypothetical protein Pth03_13990 [Planotetraspora thailandica]|uniref:AAA domain-containing protein n=1 Tax=Planotetraspora thailandica TaxID=487172 RepID=A0A8J3VA94_9ACTN|nr:TcpE family conjugal transfer membrane protein [Planotetraspora thailandica]GII53010.1 hypothetical protein Pth03_13990 [Planotetraspora thailandica]
MDLPTYTNIWRIEKRLYKLYDLRLPMPLPIVWIGVFVGVSVPWWVLLWLVKVPFAAPWHVVYLLPPGIVTWLSTRPVIEGKRLTEVLQSQLRYLAEPRTWCRMAPSAEPEEVSFTARVWRIAPPLPRVSVKAARRAEQPAVAAAEAAVTADTGAEVAGTPIRGMAARNLASTGSPSRRPAAEAGSRGGGSRGRAVRGTGSAGPSVRGTAGTPVRGTGSGGSGAGPGKGKGTGKGTGSGGARGRGRGKAVEPWTPERAIPPRPVPPAALPPVALPRAESRPAESRPAAALPPAESRPAELRPTDLRSADSAEPARPTPAVPAAGSPATVHPAVAAAAAAASAVPETPPASDPAFFLPAAQSGPSSDAGQVPADPRPGAATQPEVRPGDASQESPQEPGAAERRGTAPAPPIGTEALRRLRRLAASAEHDERNTPELPPGVPVPRALDSRPEATKPQAIAPKPPTIGSLTPPEAVAPEAPQHAPEKTSGTPAPSPDVTGARPEAPDVRPDASEPDAGASEQEAGATAPRTAGPSERQREAWEQHRKGQPPRPVRPVETQRPTEMEGPSGTRGPAEAGGGESRPAEAVRPAEAARAAETGQPSTPPVLPSGPASPVAPGTGHRGVSIRTVPSASQVGGPSGPASPVLPPTTTPGAPVSEPRVRRVESVVGRGSSGGWRKLAQVVVGGSRTDGMEIDEARARTPLTTSRRIMVLGCTGGAGQTTTALMLGHTLARYRDDRVLALDANSGDDTLTSRIQAESPETLTSLLEGSRSVSGYLGMRSYTSRCESGLEVVGADTDAGAEQRLSDRALLNDWRRTLATLDQHYRLVVVDPAAALAARLLPYTDQLVLVAPASEDASESIAMTYEWLDGHGVSDLRRRAVMVINGVSRRSMPDVEQAEAVASGRCRAIVRVPWEDELAPGRPGPVDVNHLRTGGRRAYVALAGVIVSGLATIQAKQEVAK